MPILKKLTPTQIEKIQIDEGVIFKNYGENDEQLLAPCRGGGEFSATATVRDIEFDGRNGKTAGLQAIEEQAASLKTTTINMSQESLLLAMPFARFESSDSNANNKIIKNPKMGVISNESYLKNVTMFAKLIDGTYKKITIYNAMHEDGISVKAVQKAEGELELTFQAHYSTDNLDGDLWKIEDISEMTMQEVSETQKTSTTQTTEE